MSRQSALAHCTRMQEILISSPLAHWLLPCMSAQNPEHDCTFAHRLSVRCHCCLSTREIRTGIFTRIIRALAWQLKSSHSDGREAISDKPSEGETAAAADVVP